MGFRALAVQQAPAAGTGGQSEWQRACTRSVPGGTTLSVSKALRGSCEHELMVSGTPTSQHGRRDPGGHRDIRQSRIFSQANVDLSRQCGLHVAMSVGTS